MGTLFSIYTAPRQPGPKQYVPVKPKGGDEAAQAPVKLPCMIDMLCTSATGTVAAGGAEAAGILGAPAHLCRPGVWLLQTSWRP